MAPELATAADFEKARCGRCGRILRPLEAARAASEDVEADPSARSGEIEAQAVLPAVGGLAKEDLIVLPASPDRKPAHERVVERRGSPERDIRIGVEAAYIDVRSDAEVAEHEFGAPAHERVDPVVV